MATSNDDDLPRRAYLSGWNDAIHNAVRVVRECPAFPKRDSGSHMDGIMLMALDTILKAVKNLNKPLPVRVAYSETPGDAQLVRDNYGKLFAVIGPFERLSDGRQGELEEMLLRWNNDR